MANVLDSLENRERATRATVLPRQTRGRGARSNETGRFERAQRYLFDDGWDNLGDAESQKTEVFIETAKRIITRNESPDVSFDRSINPYRGCEHGCSYCYARPSHAYVGLSPGLDFESKIFAKTNAVERLKEELAEPGYEAATIALGANTDPYQPIERRFRLTRGILEVLSDCEHPVGVITKSALVGRDLDLLQPMAEKGLVKVAISVTTLRPELARAMEPRASTPLRRLQALETLSKAGVPTCVMVAPIIPALNDSEIEAILKAASAAGVREAGYVLLRLPWELKDLFREWLLSELPERAGHVLSAIRSTRNGKENDSAWGRRMRGTGPYAWSIGRRFELACARLGLNGDRLRLDSGRFRPPVAAGAQLPLL
jgi:DNA repair photolyase